MNRYLVLALLLVVPLILIVLVALSMYGLEGPADNDTRANAILYLIGIVYGSYAVVSFVVWRRKP